MEYQFRWIEAPWLMGFKASGELVGAELAASAADQIRYLDAADGKVYWVCDVRELHLKADMRVIAALADSPALRHPNSGISAFIGSTTMLKFVASIIIQKAKSETGLHIFATPEEAEAFCREVAAVDPHRATVCAPIITSRV